MPSLAFSLFVFCFFLNDTATTEIYTLSLHDALPISRPSPILRPPRWEHRIFTNARKPCVPRSEEHTSELQSPQNLVCRLLLEKYRAAARCEYHLARRHPSVWRRGRPARRLLVFLKIRAPAEIYPFPHPAALRP